MVQVLHLQLGLFRACRCVDTGKKAGTNLKGFLKQYSPQRVLNNSVTEKGMKKKNVRLISRLQCLVISVTNSQDY